MGSNDLGGASMEALVGAFVELDRELADDLRIAVGRYTSEQMKGMAGDARWATTSRIVLPASAVSR